MEGIKGLCVLCTRQTTVIFPHQSKHITCKLFELLKQHIDAREYEPALCEIEVCLSCLYQIVSLSTFKENIADVCENANVCSLCQAQDNLVLTNSLDNFRRLVKKVLLKETGHTAVCLQCFMHLKWLDRIKDNFFKKYSFLKLGKSGDTFERQLRHLKPLKNLDFFVNASKEDDKLWAKVPYVKLNVCKQNKRSFKKLKKPKPYKSRKIIKLKLWQNLKQVSPANKKAKLMKKELVVNLTKAEFKEKASEIDDESLELEQIAGSHLAQATFVDSDEEWAAAPQTSYVEHLQKNNDDIFNELIKKSSLTNGDNSPLSTIVSQEVIVQEEVIVQANSTVDEIIPQSITDQPVINGTSCDKVEESTDTNQPLRIEEQMDFATTPTEASL